MVGNLLVDAALGAVPIAGDVVDVFFRAHRRNLELLQRELQEPSMTRKWTTANVRDDGEPNDREGAWQAVASVDAAMP